MFDDGWGLASNQIGGKNLLYGTDGSEQIIEFEADGFKELRHIPVKDPKTKKPISDLNSICTLPGANYALTIRLDHN